jgi:hypothetical protein
LQRSLQKGRQAGSTSCRRHHTHKRALSTEGIPLF